MTTAEVVERDVQSYGGLEIFQLLTESIRQSG